MANKEHLKILNQGVDAWNQWRENNPDILPNLSRTDLGQVNLSGANLSRVDFCRADLSKVDLSEADLGGADLNGAYLIRANLSDAALSKSDLSGATLSWANLGGANLSDADLSRANLSDADLSGANLSDADLSGATLSNADLSGANLIRANLGWADLSGADLSRADLSRANFRGTNLSGTNLTGANLSEASLLEANLLEAHLRCTNFQEVRLGGSLLANVDLREVIGLETVIHYGPSSIGIDTIYLSQGKIPGAFLRGAGIPQNLIEFLPSHVGKAIQYYPCFVSYSTKDQEFAELLHSDLQAKGVRVWLAPEGLKIGDRFRQRIDESISLYDKLLLVLSQNSIDSTWVEEEVETAYEKERKHNNIVLFPIRLDSSIWETDQAWTAEFRRLRHIGDFSNWKNHDAYKLAFDQLLRDLTEKGQ